MLKDLATFFKNTEGGRNIPRSLRPSISRSINHSLLGHGGKIIAESLMPDGRRFQISQEKIGQDLWLEIYRKDGTLEEQQNFLPNVRAYTTNITKFDETGTKIMQYAAYSSDGRLVDHIWRDDANQFQRMAHHYPDLQGIAYNERTYFGMVIQCHSSVERTYRNLAGNIERDEYFGPDQKITHELHYDDDTQKVIAKVQYQPGTHAYQLVTTYNDNGIKDSEEFYDSKGAMQRAVHYYTEHAQNESEIIKQVERLYSSGVMQTETKFREDGTPRMRTTYDKDGKTRVSEESFNVTGDFVTDRREFHNGKITKKIQMGLHSDEAEVKRIILYDDKGRPYRSREHRRWDTTGDDFWAETDINPQNGMPIASILPTPTGLVKHAFDAKSGRLRTIERHREEALGETLEQRTHYHPAPARVNHPEQDAPLVTSRIEDFDIDGATLTHIKEFRTDGSIKAEDNLENDGSWVHRVYPEGTTRIEDDTPVLFESTRRPDGTLESSILRGHSDPDILSLQKDYDEKGKPTHVHIEHLEGSEDLSWEEYTRRRKVQREAIAPALVRLATITPDIEDTETSQNHNGRTLITLQGDESALRRVQARIEQRFANARCDLCVGDKQLLQYRNLTGRYVQKEPGLENHPLIEKVNVLSIVVPYTPNEADRWPKQFATKDVMGDDAADLRQRGVEEAAEVMRKIRRLSNCDLGLTITPGVTPQKDDNNKTQHYPHVTITWANKPYLPPAQCEVLSQMLTDDVMVRNYACTHIPGQSEIDVFASNWSFMPNVASRIASDTAKEIETLFVPAALRKSEPEKQH